MPSGIIMLSRPRHELNALGPIYLRFSLILLAIGVLVGMFGSYKAVKKYLKI